MNRSRLPVVLAIVVAVVAIVVGVVVIRGANDAPVAARQLTCLGGSEKSALMADAEVRAILRDEYGLEVRFDKRGSYDVVQLPTDQLRDQKIIACGRPPPVPAASSKSRTTPVTSRTTAPNRCWRRPR
ncbi:hypothetical protein [Nocardia asiatica]|uniref:hypothetical protein n=1 Tax=Nocardia asiatica TaxID=209252 RepID=UPI003EE2A878